MRKFVNAVQSILLLGIMGVIFAFIGKLIAGLEGIAVAVISCIVVFILSPRLSPAIVLQMYQARRLLPEEAPGLYRIIGRLADSAHLSVVPALHYIPSSIMNAFSLGRKDKTIIAVTDGLIRSLTGDEIAGIMAHEVSHIKNKDLWIMGLADLISRFTNVFSFIGIFFLILYFPAIFLGWVEFSLWTAAVIFFAPYASVLLQLALSRTREYEADAGAVTLTGDPGALAAALGKIDQYPVKIWDLIFLPGQRVPAPSILRTHPHTKKRIARLMDIAERRPGIRAEASGNSNDLKKIMQISVSPVTRRPRRRIGGFWH
jgi:heat shock protein HtpX